MKLGILLKRIFKAENHINKKDCKRSLFVCKIKGGVLGCPFLPQTLFYIYIIALLIKTINSYGKQLFTVRIKFYIKG